MPFRRLGQWRQARADPYLENHREFSLSRLLHYQMVAAILTQRPVDLHRCSKHVSILALSHLIPDLHVMDSVIVDRDSQALYEASGARASAAA